MNIKSGLKYIVFLLLPLFGVQNIAAQINTEQVTRIGQNALYFEDYMLSIQYFNQAISAKPYNAKPYLYRAIAKYNLEDYSGAEKDASKAIELHPFLTDAYEVRGVARQNLGKDSLAVGDYEMALKLMPRNRQLLFNKALALQATKQYAKADSTYDELIRYYPRYSNLYLGRARMRLETNDTVKALEDIGQALVLDKQAVNAYIMRADIAIHSEKNYKSALSDMDEAIRLQPRLGGLYINRAFLRYNLDDYFGAMADYDYAIQLEPLNYMAIFNRGLLLAEVNANDRALQDFTKVLELNPDDYRALYNRALILNAKGRYADAISDINRVIEQFPTFAGGYSMRSEFKRLKGDLTGAEKDYKKALSLAKSARPVDDKAQQALRDSQEGAAPQSPDGEIPSDLAARRFASLLTTDNNVEIKEEYNNSAIRGKVQDRNLSIDIEPMILLSYYSSTDELRGATYYIKEVDELNATRMLNMNVNVTNRIPSVDEDLAKRHFESIEYYNSYLSTHKPRAIDHLGRAMDFITTRNYDSALKDADKSLELAPDNAVGLFLKFQSLYGQYLTLKNTPASEDDSEGISNKRILMSSRLGNVRDALDNLLKVSPNTAVAWFDKGNLLLETNDFTSALSAYSKAVELKPDMGEAYFNRGYVYLKLGNQHAGIADLSKAGELGIIAAYNLIKRISN